ncbi:MAG: autotransporter-associated beta strand repeat-containing protein [Chlamydiales bacterium]|nr:autotransporter-associated beta strand repeat-containing protein [Chlamydiales bacterium]
MRNTTINGNGTLYINRSGATVKFDATNNGTAQINGTLKLPNSGTVYFDIDNGTDTPDMLINSNIISSGGGLTKTGPGTLELTGANTYSGGTTISQGTLRLSGTGSLSPTGSVQLVNGTTFDLSSSTIDQTIGDLSGNAGSQVLLGTNQLTFGTNNTNPQTFGGVISDLGKLVKQGTGTAILTGTNTYSGGTTVSDGNLQGTYLSLQGNIVNDATVTFNQGGTGPYNGMMSGSGKLVKEGIGGLNLTNTNTYTGGTFISSGGLQATTSSLVGTITLSNGGVIKFDQSTAGTYSGNIVGNGVLEKSGTGTVILSGANTYTGGTGVNEGILQGTTSSLQKTISNAATVVFDQSTNGTYSGVMNGVGALIKQGTGTVILSGPNLYTGGTTVSEGTLQGTTISLRGAITNNATLIFDQTITGTYEGVITGSGNFVKNGSGGVTLSNTHSYTGTTDINAGVLKVLGSIGSSTTTVNTGAYLTGIGSVGPTTNSGTISPGNSIGILTINGDYTQNAGANLAIEINDDGSSDLLFVTGIANLNGTVTVTPQSGIYSADSRFTFMNYASRTGTLTLVEDPSLNFTINYQPTFAELITVSNNVILPYPKRLLKGNPRAVADYLFCKGFYPSNPDLLDVLQTLLDVGSYAFAEDLVKLSPVQFGALPLANLQSHRLVSDIIVENTEKFFWCDPCFNEITDQKDCPQRRKKTSFWIAPIGNYYHQDSLHKQRSWANRQIGFSTYSAGISLGASHLFFDNLHVGGGMGYTHSHIDWSRDRGDGHWNSIYFGPSIGWSKSNGYLNLLVLGSYNLYNINRKIDFLDLKRTAHNKHHSYDVLARLDGGYKFRVLTGGDLEYFFFLPEASISYLNIFENSYTESGASSINLAVDSKYSAFLQPTVLFKFLRDFYLQKLCVTPTFQIGWIANVPLSSGAYRSKLYKQSTCESHFNVKSFHDTTSQMTLGGELVFRTDDHWIIELGYKADVFDKQFVQNGKIKVEKRF